MRSLWRWVVALALPPLPVVMVVLLPQLIFLFWCVGRVFFCFRMEDARNAIVFSAFSRRRFCEEQDCLEVRAAYYARDACCMLHHSRRDGILKCSGVVFGFVVIICKVQCFTTLLVRVSVCGDPSSAQSVRRFVTTKPVVVLDCNRQLSLALALALFVLRLYYSVILFGLFFRWL